MTIVNAITLSTADLTTPYTFNIPADKQKKNAVYTLKTSGNKNAQLSKIVITYNYDNNVTTCDTPAFTQNGGDVFHGSKIIAKCATQNSTVSILNADDNTVLVKGADKAGMAEFVVPEDAELGTQYKLIATASVEGTTGIINSAPSATTTFTVNVTAPTEPQPAGLEFAESTYTVKLNNTSFTGQEVSNPNNLTVTYSSSVPEVATVDAETGVVTLVAVGSTVISAKSAATTDYLAGEASYTITVEPADAPEPVSPNTYKKVTSASQLKEGVKYVIISAPFTSGSVQYGSYVMTGAKTTGFSALSIDANETTLKDEYILDNAEISYLQLEKDGDNWVLKSGDSYLQCKAVKKMQLSTTKDEYCAVTITPSADKTSMVFVKTKDSSKDVSIQMFAQNSKGKPANELFNAYSSDQHLVFLYVNEAPEAPAIPEPSISGDYALYHDEANNTWSVYASHVTENLTLTLTAEEGAYIYYKKTSTSTTPDEPAAQAEGDGFTEVQNNVAEITLNMNESGSVQFYSMKNGVASKTGTLEYNVSTGIDGIEAEDGEAVYYNLQGVKVENPEKGLYIRVSGNKAVKVAK